MSPHPASPPPDEHSTAHPGQRDSFLEVAAFAREVLRERGLSEDQIDAELHRAQRTEE